MKKLMMLIMICIISFFMGMIVFASFDNIEEGDKQLRNGAVSQTSSSAAQAYYLRDIAESLREIKKWK